MWDVRSEGVYVSVVCWPVKSRGALLTLACCSQCTCTFAAGAVLIRSCVLGGVSTAACALYSCLRTATWCGVCSMHSMYSDGYSCQWCESVGLMVAGHVRRVWSCPDMSSS